MWSIVCCCFNKKIIAQQYAYNMPLSLRTVAVFARKTFFPTVIIPSCNYTYKCQTPFSQRVSRGASFAIRFVQTPYARIEVHVAHRKRISVGPTTLVVTGRKLVDEERYLCCRGREYSSGHSTALKLGRDTWKRVTRWKSPAGIFMFLQRRVSV